MNWTAWLGQELFSLHQGEMVLFDKTISSATQDLADLLRRDVWSIGYYEWLNLVRESVAYALDAINPNTDFPIMVRDFLDSVKSSLNQSSATIGSFEFAFGCTLFDGITPSPHRIGSVLLEARQDWLERKFADGAISSLMRERLLRAWNGQQNRKRKRTRDSYIEKSILSMSNDAPFICSVTTNSMTFGFGRQRAKIAARLALASIALLWNPTSKVLDKMNLVEDRTFRIINEISFQNRKIFLRESQVTLAGWAKVNRR
ncbi:hypothetical protein [Azospirillum humicireducens]|uniref:hypothetical protein n=1 Tax=Azospirillum humicireducens TaxID=1226968 RepID=UPI0011B23188|nr:hypothetical protein [Azospirillum humicireducens]